ncbi:MAG TPA: Calx-beta domain-containing protein [Polyangiaceae bacterium]|nr:Calx-beta domain-containing protein [Polyangiaceae bacterium]
MTAFVRWLRLLILSLSVALPTLGCQLLFGDFKIGERARNGEGGQGSSGESAGAGVPGSPGGGAGSGQPSGPLVVVPTSDLFTSDNGAFARFYVSLSQKPTASVSVPIRSTNTKEGDVSPDTLSFTQDNWNAPQPVTVTGAHDPQVGNQLYTVKVGPAKSDDKFFDGALTEVSITNIDNDGPGFFVTPTRGLVTTEAGGEAHFTVVLNSAPQADVIISLSSSDSTIGKVTPASLTFTPANWMGPQTVTVTGVDNVKPDGDQTYQIQVGPLMSDDKAYENLSTQTVFVTNQDNDKPGLIVVLSEGIDPSDPTRLRTSEAGETATFKVALNQKPMNEVTIQVESNSSEGKASPDTLTFTPANWAIPQTVTVVGVDNDTVADGNQPYQIKLGPISGGDPAFGQLSAADLPSVNVINVDNDSANFAVTLLTGIDPNDASQLLTGENGASAKFSVALTSKPSGTVRFLVSSTNSNEGTVSPGQLDFTDSWNTAQVVTVTGVNDDNTKDGNILYAVRVSVLMADDPNYQKLSPVDIKVVNVDDDVAGITPPKLLSGIDSGNKLITTENGGTATFSIALTSKPKADVTVPVMSSNTAEGKVMPVTLTFTPVNYMTAQVVTVTGQNDSKVDGNQAYTVTVGPSKSPGDANYEGLSQTVKVTNQDDDSAYIVPTPGYSGTTTEKGGTATFGITLHSQPTDNVTLTFASSNTSEGKVAPMSLLFTPSNWSQSQNITVTGVDDDKDDGDVSYTIAVKGTGTMDKDYQYAATTLTLTNTNDDKAGLKVTAAANLQTTEAGGKVTFTVALNSQPAADVKIAVTSSNVNEGTVAPASLTFTANNWSSTQTVTVTGVDESVADGNQTFTVSLKASGSDTKYAQLAASTVSIVNKDDDKVGITVAPTSCATTPGTSEMFTVVLKSQPLGPVSIALSSDNTNEGKVTPATLSFTAANWNNAQTVTVTGVDDGTTDTMTTYKIVTAAAVSAMDSNYNGFNADDVACVNTTPPAPAPGP